MCKSTKNKNSHKQAGIFFIFLSTSASPNLPNIYVLYRKSSDSACRQKKKSIFFAWADKDDTMRMKKTETEREGGRKRIQEIENSVPAVMDSLRKRVRMVLCKLAASLRVALVIIEDVNNARVPRHERVLLFSFPPTTLGVDSS